MRFLGGLGDRRMMKPNGPGLVRENARRSFALDGEPRNEKTKASAPTPDPSGVVVVVLAPDGCGPGSPVAGRRCRSWR